MASSDHWAQQLKDNIKLIAEIAVPLISISVAVYLASRKCKGRNRADPESPNEGPEAIIEMIQVAENESARENQITSEIAALVISICVAVYLAFRICKRRNRANPKSPNEGQAVTIEMEQVTERICPR
nr:hypothetical protein CFP56_62596 [Quercus suber]POE75216.1 hypothetical protein CFP56_76030 [Quercus suber]